MGTKEVNFLLVRCIKLKNKLDECSWWVSPKRIWMFCLVQEEDEKLSRPK